MSGEQPIERVPLVAPVPSILTSARPLPGDTALNLRRGVTWTPASCFPSTNTQGVCEDDNPAADGLDGAVRTGVFTITTPLECDWGDQAEIEAAARALTDVHTAHGVARALWLGDGLEDEDDQPTFRRVGVDVTVGAEMDLDDAAAVLLSTYERCTGGNGGAVLHVPSQLIPGALGGIAGGGRIAWPEGNVYRGPLGAVVSPGPGYPHGDSDEGVNGFGPKVSGSGSATVYKGNDLDEAWIYVTGPIEYVVGEVEVLSATESARRNRAEVVTQRRGVARFDPCCVFAAKVTNVAGLVS